MLESLVPDIGIGRSTAYIRKIKIVTNCKFFVVARCPIEKNRFIFSAYFGMFFAVRAALSHVRLTIRKYYFSCRKPVVIFYVYCFIVVNWSPLIQCVGSVITLQLFIYVRISLINLLCCSTITCV